MAPELDIARNRQARKYARSENARRVLWAVGGWLFGLSPRPCFGWRRWVLRRFGASVGPHVHVYPTARIHFPWNLSLGAWTAIGDGVLIYNPGLVTIGEKVTISHRAHLCAGSHDYAQADLPLVKPPIRIGDQAWICTEAFLGPGVTVGEGAVVGARAVAVSDVPPWTVVAGNPAKPIKPRTLAPSNQPAL